LTFQSTVDTHIQVGRTGTEKDLEMALEVVTEGRKGFRRVTADFSLEAADSSVAEEAESVRTVSRDWVHGSGVQGLGIGDKLTHGEPTGELALRVYVEKKKPKTKVANPVPKVVSVPGVGEQITDVIELGRVVPELFTERVRPAMPGSGLGHTAVTVGTFGCLVRKKGDESGLYVLSNAHVLANEGLAVPGDGIVQPGSLDGGSSDGDSFARLTDFVPFEFTDTSFPNLVDAAIAKVRRRSWAGPKLRILDITPAGVSKTVRRGMHIKKVGRTTDYTTGVIADVHLRLALRYHRPSGSGRARVGFRDQVLCTRYSAGGDSGSVILNNNDMIVGLHFAGAASGSVFNRITHVLELLDIEVV
jgi:hypothetical protein